MVSSMGYAVLSRSKHSKLGRLIRSRTRKRIREKLKLTREYTRGETRDDLGDADVVRRGENIVVDRHVIAEEVEVETTREEMRETLF